MNLRPWHLSLGLALVCAAAVGGMMYLRYARQTDRTLLARLPSQQSAFQAYIDVKSLRQAGMLELLAGSRAAEETDYRKFVEATQFDYRTDLDAVYAAFEGETKTFLLRGRFAWDEILKYAQRHGADCQNTYCFVETKRFGRFLSLYPAYPNVLAVGIGRDMEVARGVMTRRISTDRIQVPRQPFWVSIPREGLDQSDSVPDGTRAFLNAVKGAERVTIGVGVEGDVIEAELLAHFKAAADAEGCRKRLEETTGMLRKFLARANVSPNPRDLSSALMNGRFEQQGERVVGRWPIDRAFLEALAAGGI